MTLTSRRALLGAAAVVGLSPLTGCGFRLRGHFDLPFETMYLDMNRNTPFASRLERHLKAGAGVRLVPSISEAQAILKILSQSNERRAVAYNANGDAREYELKTTLQFRLTSPEGDEFLPDTVISVTREVSYNEDEDYLSRDQSEALVLNEMQQDIVSQMIRRIEKAKLPQPAIPAADTTAKLQP